MSIHVCECERLGKVEFHLRYPDMSKEEAQSIADRINIGLLSTSTELDYTPGDWFKVTTLEELQQFYNSRLPAIREAARTLGWAIGVHGSERRDFDLMAMPWVENCANKNELAHAIAVAACGISREGDYVWETKPGNRADTSIPICWTTWHDMLSAGHIDLAVIDSKAEDLTDNLVALMFRLARALHKAKLDTMIEKQAMDYLHRQG